MLVFGYAFSLLCYAQDEPVTTYSLTTTIEYYADHTDDRISLNIKINNLEERYIVIPYYKYSPGNSPDIYYLNCSMSIYDKQEDIIYIPNRSNADNEFIGKFFDSGKINVVGPYGVISSPGTSFRCTVNDLGKVYLTSDNYKLPFYVCPDYTSGNFPFNLSDVSNRGFWFVIGNGYPFNNNYVWSDLIYYPNASGRWFLANNPTPDSEHYNDYQISFSLYDEGKVKYKDLEKYYFEIWTSTEEHPDLVFQKSYKLTNLDFIQGTNISEYRLIDAYHFIFPNSANFMNGVTNVYVRLRYSDRDIELVSSFMFWTQNKRSLEPIPPHVWLGNEDLPISQSPSDILDNTLNAGSLNGNYEFGNFNALDFVKGQGGLPSLVKGVATVFSFLPGWLWTMMFFFLGALATIALLKVVLS